MEKIHKVTRMVKCILQLVETRCGLAQVTEPGAGWQAGITYTTKAQVEQACLEEAGWRFTQANQTPFLQPPLLNDFGEIGVDRPAFHAVLEGWYMVLPGCNPAAAKLLATL